MRLEMELVDPALRFCDSEVHSPINIHNQDTSLAGQIADLRV
jgi:hypothetical protein